MSNHATEERTIVPSYIKIDPLYQRELDGARVKRIVDSWNDDLVNMPKVSYRPGSGFYCFDGQHTLAAWQKVKGDTPIKCRVYRGLSWNEEMELFVQQNGISKAVDTSVRLKAMYNGKDESVVDMVNGASDIGVSVVFEHRCNSRMRCRAVAALYNSYKTLGPVNYRIMLKTLVDAWNGDSLSLSASFINGMTVFFKRHPKEFSPSCLAKSLGKFAPNYYVREAREMTGMSGMRYYRTFVKVYNKGRKTSRINMESEK